jgi:pre-mRNA-splicing helicase BRR2
MLQEVLVYKIDKPKFNDPVTKTNILLQCHFSRKALPADFSWDQKLILEQSIRLISAMVDVMSSNCWLKPAILAIQLCQMIIQAVWIDSAPLLQLPHFTDVLA